MTKFKQHIKFYQIFIVFLIALSIYAAYNQGLKDGKTQFFKSVGRITYIQQEDIQLVEQLFKAELDKFVLLNDIDNHKLYEYQINSITPNIIIEPNGSKTICYQISYNIKPKNITPYWMAYGRGGKQTEAGWIINQSKNVEIINKNSHQSLKDHGEG